MLIVKRPVTFRTCLLRRGTSVLLYGSGAWATTLADRRRLDVFDMRCQSSGSSISATKASVNAPSNQPHHPSYDNAACVGLDMSTACHPPFLYEEYLTSIGLFFFNLIGSLGQHQNVTHCWQYGDPTYMQSFIISHSSCAELYMAKRKKMTN